MLRGVLLLDTISVEVCVNFVSKTMVVTSLIAGCMGVSSLATAQSRDVSPTILIETMPSDNPAYRRMVFVKYLNGPYVASNYKAYNRREFINVPDRSASDNVRACAGSRATPLSEIKAFERDEAKRQRKGQAPENRSFCIKNINNWNAKNKDKYLDPIFASMPYVKGK